MAARLTQAELAAQIGVQIGIVSYWEKDRRRPRTSNVVKLIRVLGPGLQIYKITDETIDDGRIFRYDEKASYLQDAE